jgi:hypothetical protein
LKNSKSGKNNYTKPTPSNRVRHSAIGHRRAISMTSFAVADKLAIVAKLKVRVTIETSLSILRYYAGHLKISET